jgi:hypothetical protein
MPKVMAKPDQGYCQDTELQYAVFSSQNIPHIGSCRSEHPSKVRNVCIVIVNAIDVECCSVFASGSVTVMVVVVSVSSADTEGILTTLYDYLLCL